MSMRWEYVNPVIQCLKTPVECQYVIPGVYSVYFRIRCGNQEGWKPMENRRSICIAPGYARERKDPSDQLKKEPEWPARTFPVIFDPPTSSVPSLNLSTYYRTLLEKLTVTLKGNTTNFRPKNYASLQLIVTPPRTLMLFLIISCSSNHSILRN